MNVKRIAMWSGPRNLSTALMRSFASRLDCSVVDEPFYAAYLKETGIDHPMKNLVLKTYSVNAKEVAYNCSTGDVLTKIQYQKHMTHHMLDYFDRSFINLVSNAFLIRSPEKVVKSFGKKVNNFSLHDLGFIQQVDLFDMVCDKTGEPPPVIDADDLCANPATVLSKLCSRLDITYSDKMLSWNSGTHPYDGVWGSYWYRSVNETTGFVLPVESDEKASNFQNHIIKKARPYFHRLNKYKIAV